MTGYNGVIHNLFIYLLFIDSIHFNLVIIICLLDCSIYLNTFNLKLNHAKKKNFKM